MSDQRSAIAEFRELEQRRLAGGLTSAEVARYDWLRRVLGRDAATPQASPGFDMGVATVDLHESLLPAGLRGRPETPLPDGGFDAAWLPEEPAPAPEVRPQAWNPAAPGYDPDAPYDEAAWIAAGYDPNVTYDWSAYGDQARDEQPGEPAAAPGQATRAPGEVVTAPAIPIPSSLVPTAEPPAEEDLPSLEVLLTDEAPVAGVVNPVAAARLADDDGWQGFEPAPVVLPDAATPAEAAQPLDELIPLDPLADGEPPASAPGAQVATFDGLLSDDELLLLASAGTPAEPTPGPTPVQTMVRSVEASGPGYPGLEAAPVEAVSLEPLELRAAAPEPAAPTDGALPALALEPVQTVVPEPPLDAPPEPPAAAAVEPLHPPLPEAVQANVFVPPVPSFTTPAWVAFVTSLHPPLPGQAVASEPPPAEPLAVPPQVEEAEDAIPPHEAVQVDAAVSVEDAVPLEVAGRVGEAAPAEGAAPFEEAPAPVSFGAYDEPAAASVRFPAGAPLPEPVVGAWDAGGEPQLDPAIQPYEPAPPGTPRGEYDELSIPAGRALENMLPFDAAVAAAIPPGSVPEGYEPGSVEEPAISIELDLPGHPVPPATLGPVAELSEVSAEWQPDAALDRGFDLASEGSFGLPELDLGETPAWPPPGPPSPPPIALASPASPALWPPPDAAASRPHPASSPEEEVLSADDLIEEALPALELTPSVQTTAPAASRATPPSAGPPRSPAGAFVAPAAGLFAGAPAHPPRPSSPAAAPRPASVFVPPAADLFARPGPAAPPPAVPSPEPEIELDLQLAEPTPAASVAPRPRAAPPAQPPRPAATATTAPGLDLEPLPPLLSSPRLQGAHRVLVHTIDGEVKRGVLKDPALDAEQLTVHPQGAGAPQVLATAAVKAVFFLLAPGEKPPRPEGRKVRVTFRDGRQVFGVSPDYQEGQVGFMLIPVEAGTTTARIWVYQASVRQVVVA